MAGEADVKPETFTKEQVEALVAERLATETEGLKSNQQRLLDEAKRAKERAKAFEGLDPEEAKGWKAKLAELETAAEAKKSGVTSDQLAKWRTEQRAEWDKENAPKLSQLETLAKENRALKLDNVVKDKMAKAGVRAERIDALYKLTGDAFDLTDDGKPMVKDSGQDVEKFINETLRKEWPDLFNGTGSTGGGAAKSNGGAGGARVVRWDGRPETFGAFKDNVDGIRKGTVKVEFP